MIGSRAVGGGGRLVRCRGWGVGDERSRSVIRSRGWGQNRGVIGSWGRGVIGSWSWGVVGGRGSGGTCVTFSRHAVNSRFMVTGAEILIKCRAVAAVECVLLAILVTEVIDLIKYHRVTMSMIIVILHLASCLGVSVVPVGVFPTAVKSCVGLSHGDWESLDSFNFIRLFF